MDTGVGIKVMRWKTDRGCQSWVMHKERGGGNGVDNGRERRPFVVGDEAVGESEVKGFDFLRARGGGMEFGGNSLNVDKAAKAMFTAEKWRWTAEREVDEMKLPKTSPSLKF